MRIAYISGGARLRPYERLPFPVAEHASPQRCRNALSDLVLNCKYVIERAIEALGPSVVSRPDVNQLDTDPEPFVGLANAPFEEGAGTELLPDGADVAAGLPELKRCCPRDDAQTIYVCERVDPVPLPFLPAVAGPSESRRNPGAVPGLGTDACRTFLTHRVEGGNRE
jgi:hypothetical protein